MSKQEIKTLAPANKKKLNLDYQDLSLVECGKQISALESKLESKNLRHKRPVLPTLQRLGLLSLRMHTLLEKEQEDRRRKKESYKNDAYSYLEKVFPDPIASPPRLNLMPYQLMSKTQCLRKAEKLKDKLHDEKHKGDKSSLFEKLAALSLVIFKTLQEQEADEQKKIEFYKSNGLKYLQNSLPDSNNKNQATPLSLVPIYKELAIPLPSPEGT